VIVESVLNVRFFPKKSGHSLLVRCLLRAANSPASLHARLSAIPTPVIRMARLKRRLRSASRHVPLSSEAFASLKKVNAGRRTIPDEHREWLAKAGYIREVMDPSDGISAALALTGRGHRRLDPGK
jgi:hypothetical protein